jgi:hypothetical protein
LRYFYKTLPMFFDMKTLNAIDEMEIVEGKMKN